MNDQQIISLGQEQVGKFDVGIVGGGFSGAMTAVQLIDQSDSPISMVIFEQHDALCRGVAYAPYSGKHLLNVAAANMSAFPDRPEHFLDWVMMRPDYQAADRAIVANAFLPRRLYGEYLRALWDESLGRANEKGVAVTVVPEALSGLDPSEGAFKLRSGNGAAFRVERLVIATGNHLPRNPAVRNMAFYRSSRYFGSPWGVESVSQVEQGQPVLIIGNGLTMVDTVLGLLEQGHHGKIISLSPNGFNILPHRHSGMRYTGLAQALERPMDLRGLVRLVNQQIKAVRAFGVSAEPVIDALRPHTQRIWSSFSEAEKRLFMARLRHLWGVARHRIPTHIHDRLQRLRIDGQLSIVAGRLVDLVETGEGVTVVYHDRRTQTQQQFTVSRVINCTGPETDISRMHGSFLKQCLGDGLLVQDSLKLGVLADPDTFRVLRPDGTPHENLFTLGSNLKGVLWESTAVRELREQAARLGGILAQVTRIHRSDYPTSS